MKNTGEQIAESNKEVKRNNTNRNTNRNNNNPNKGTNTDRSANPNRTANPNKSTNPNRSANPNKSTNPNRSANPNKSVNPNRSTSTNRNSTNTNKMEQQDTKPYAPRQHKPYKPKNKYVKPVAKVEEVVVVEETVNENMLYGRNSVIELLKTDRDIDKLFIQKGAGEGSIKKIIAEAKNKGIVIQEVDKIKLDELTENAKHQGVLAYVSAQRYSTIEEILNDAKSKEEDPFIIILENIQDPHNLGAIIRSAHNAGVHGIIIPKRRAVGLTATVSKASAGAIEHMKVAKVTNIAQTIEELKQKGIWVACADMHGKIIYQDNLRGAIGIVIGSEGEGVSKLVKEKCDFTISIPMYGKVTSLNASVAASILAYEVVRQRHF